MKKILVIAALASIVFASCQKEAPVAAVQNEGQQEITFSALSKAMTKGVLGTGAFETSGEYVRSIIAAGVMKTADGQIVDFLEASKFDYDGTAGAWKTVGKYYPIGGSNNDYHFLAYSESKGVESVARWYGSTEVEIQVGDESAKNDIVYSAFKGNKGDKATATFKHTQALVTVEIKTKTAGQTITINKIGFKDVKTSGTLNIKLDKSKVGTADDAVATPKWIFNAGCNCACAEMGNYWLPDCYVSTETEHADKFKVKQNVESQFTDYNETATNKGYGVIDNTGCIFDRFFPAQTIAAQTMIVNYTLGDTTAEVELPLDATGTPTHAAEKTWDASTRYVYSITVNPAEILISPTADAWTVDTLNAGEYN